MDMFQSVQIQQQEIINRNETETMETNEFERKLIISKQELMKKLVIKFKIS